MNWGDFVNKEEQKKEIRMKLLELQAEKRKIGLITLEQTEANQEIARKRKEINEQISALTKKLNEL